MMYMENLHGNMHVFVLSCYENTKHERFQFFLSLLLPPLHHNGKGYICERALIPAIHVVSVAARPLIPVRGGDKLIFTESTL